MRVLSNLLDRKMDSDEEKYFLGIHESLLCIHTVLSILSGQGETLTLDPHRFYNHLDRIIDALNADSEVRCLQCENSEIFLLLRFYVKSI